MSKETKVSVGYGITINLGNYESARIDMSKERPLELDEDYEETLSIEFDHLVAEVEKKRDKLLKLYKQKREEGWD